MNKRFFFSISRIIAGLIFFVLLFSHCGGGFKSDSANAVQFEKTIFGKDTLE